MIYYHHSSSRDPFYHLALELSLLYSTPRPWPNSCDEILLTYINRPSVLMGRFQNPWLEVNLELLQNKNVSLLRRMSGGG